MVLGARNAAVAAGLATSGVVFVPEAARAAQSASPSPEMGSFFPFLLLVCGGIVAAGVASAEHARRDEGRHAEGAHAAGGHVAAVDATASHAVVGAPSATGWHGSHFAAAEELGREVDALGGTGELAAPPRGAHFRRTAAGEAADSPRDALAALPQVGADPSASADLEQVAQSYVDERSRARRRAVRRRGVAAVLMERMDRQGREEMPADVPHIQRGRSLVGDLDTWWAEAEPVTSQIVSERQTSAAELELRREQERRTAAERRRAAEAIARRVAPVEEGAFPERRTLEDAGGEDDLWAQALRAMDERLRADAAEERQAETADTAVIGGEGTQVLPHRGAQPRADFDSTESYVDYLVSDEVARDVRRRARRMAEGASGSGSGDAPSYLKVIEGGTTGRLMARPRKAAKAPQAHGVATADAVGDEAEEPVGRHFAVAAEA